MRHSETAFALSSRLALATGCLLLGACANLASLKSGNLNLNMGGGGGDSATSAPAKSAAGPSSAAAGKADDASCKAWVDKLRKEVDDVNKAEVKDAETAKAVSKRWDDLSMDPAGQCNDSEGHKSLITPLADQVDKIEGPLKHRIIRAAMVEDPMWARNLLFKLFRDDDTVVNEDLRKVARDLAKVYDAYLEKMFKANGGLGKKDNGQVMCVYSRSALPAGGKATSGFTTHFDGPGVIHVGCRLMGPVNGQNGKILLDLNADTGPVERQLVEVDLGHSSALGKTDWLTGKFTLPAGADFAKTVHYTFDAQVIVRDIWDKQTILTQAVFTWHK